MFDEEMFVKPGPEAGAYVRSVRTDVFKMTQDAFASLLGVGASTLRGWETGTTGVPRYVLRAVRVMELDPGAVMACLGTGVEAEREDTGWEAAGGRLPGTSRRRRESARQWMEADPERREAMQVLDAMHEFNARYVDLGYPGLSMGELLLLRLNLLADGLRAE